MKKYSKYLAVLLLGIAGIYTFSYAMSIAYSGALVDDRGLAYNNTFTLDVGGNRIDNLSFQIVYGSMSPPTDTFTTGTASSATLTVVSNTVLSTANASNFLTVVATTGYSAASITINGVTLTEGNHWSMNVTAASETAKSIKSAINNYVSGVVASTGLASGRAVVVFATASVAGLSGNSIGWTVSTASLTVNSATFTGGRDNATVMINGIPLVANRDFVVGASTAATANNIYLAITANTSLNTVVVATATSGGVGNYGIVWTTSTSVGTSANYSLYSSTQTALKWTAGAITAASNGSATSVMTGATNSAFTLSSANISKASHGYTTGLAVLYTTSTNVAIQPLSWGTTYFAIYVDRDNLKLASSKANATAGTAITITSSSTQTTAATYTLTPVAISGTPSWKWQVSNDGTNYTDLSTPATYSVGAFVFPTTSTVVDLGSVNFRYYRFNFTAPTNGAMNITVTGNGKRYD